MYVQCHEGLVTFIWAVDEVFSVVDAEPISDFFSWVVDLDEGPASVDSRIKVYFTILDVFVFGVLQAVCAYMIRRVATIKVSNQRDILYKSWYSSMPS